MSKDALAVARRQIESLQDGELQAAQHGTESDLISLYRSISEADRLSGGPDGVSPVSA